MIASIEGVVDSIAGDSVVLVVGGGVGYRVYCGTGTLARAREGATLKLRTHHLVREDTQALYGFPTTEELGFFELLLTVTGVGPKVAQRIVAELKDKVPALAGLDGAHVALRGALDDKRAPRPVADAVSALVNLGYAELQASGAVAAAMKAAGEGATAEKLIRLGLKELAR